MTTETTTGAHLPAIYLPGKPIHLTKSQGGSEGLGDFCHGWTIVSGFRAPLPRRG
jgi:hypothetical protein